MIITAFSGDRKAEQNSAYGPIRHHVFEKG